MLSLLTGTLILAAIHALIPNHWLPLVAVAKAEGWKQKEITTVTLLAAAAHVFGTIALGIVLGFIGEGIKRGIWKSYYRCCCNYINSLRTGLFHCQPAAPSSQHTAGCFSL